MSLLLHGGLSALMVWAALHTAEAQTPRAIDRFWRQVLVSAVNEELDRMAALHGFTRDDIDTKTWAVFAEEPAIHAVIGGFLAASGILLVTEAGGTAERDPHLDNLAHMTLEADTLEEKVILMQVFYERLIIPRFRLIARSSRGFKLICMRPLFGVTLMPSTPLAATCAAVSMASSLPLLRSTGMWPMPSISQPIGRTLQIVDLASARIWRRCRAATARWSA